MTAPPAFADAVRAADVDPATRPFLAAVRARLVGGARADTAVDAAIETLRAGGTLDDAAARAACLELIAGSVPDAHAGALLTLLAPERLAPSTIAVFARVMREHAVPVRPRLAPGTPLLDTCGTGGDGLGTFNVSTTVMFIAAAAGVAVAKHGNRAATSRSGSADVLEALGVRIDLDAEQVARCIEDVGVGFMFAQRFHQAYRNVARIRQQLTAEAPPGTTARTVFNILGPLANPAAATHQVLGVSGRELVPVLAQVVARLPIKRALVVHGAADVGGMDELSTAGPSELAEVRDGRIASSRLDATTLGLAAAAVADFRGGDAPANAATLRAILSGRDRGARADLVLLNAAAALYVAGAADSLATGLQRARDLIASGDALRRVDLLRDRTQAFD